MKNNPVKAKVDYDFVEDIFYARPAEREDYKESILLDDFVLDLNSRGEIVGVEILHFARMLNISKYFISHARKGQLDILIDKEHIRLNINLAGEFRNKERERFLDFERENAYGISPSSLVMPITS